MKNSRPLEEPTRFKGNIRHYHRSGVPPQRTWDQWVDGGDVKPAGKKSRWKIIGVVIGVLGLCGIAIGLIVELG